MDLQGNLSVFTVTSVLQMLKLAGAEGELRLEAAHNGGTLFFSDGEIVFAKLDVPPPEKLGSYLVRRRYITEEQLQQALDDYEEKKDASRRLGSYLVENEALSPETLTAIIQGRMVEVVYQLIAWNKGSFAFHHGVKPEDEDILLDVALDHLVLEGLKRLDEASQMA